MVIVALDSDCSDNLGDLVRPAKLKRFGTLIVIDLFIRLSTFLSCTQVVTFTN